MYTVSHALVRWTVLFLALSPLLTTCYTSSPWRCFTKLHLKNKEQTSMTLGVGRQSEKAAEDFVAAVVTGVNLGSTLLSVTNWPIQRGLDVFSQGLSLISALMSWFNFLASFVTPGGSGAGVLTWLRGNPTGNPLQRAYTPSHHAHY